MLSHIGHHLYRARVKELNELYFSMSLRTFAISLVSIFIPIYLYNLGFGLRGVFLYFLLVNLFTGVGEYISGWFVSRYGAKHILAMSYPATAVSFVFLITMPTYHWPLWFLALTNAIPLNLFWIPYHDDFSKAKHKNATGKELGKQSILIAIFGALGPVLGGVIAKESGIQISILISICILMVALFPLLKGSEITQKRPINLKLFSMKRNYKDLIAYGGFGLEHSAAYIVWPLVIYLIVKDFVKVGTIATITILIMIAFSIYIGRLTDKYKKTTLIKASGILGFFTSFSRILVTSVNTAYVVSIFSSVAHVLLYIPFTSTYYIHADKEPRIEYIVGMETAIDIFRAVGFGILYGATFFLGAREALAVGIILGAIGTLLTTLIADRDSKKDLPKSEFAGL